MISCLFKRGSFCLSLLLISVLFATSLSGCGRSGKVKEEASSPSDKAEIRAVALSKSLGELWLLAGGELIGITEDGLELKGAENAAVVGTTTKPVEEAIIALNPDLVLLSAELSAHLKVKEKLDSVGIRAMAISVNSFDEYAGVMKELTEITGHDKLYELNVVKVKNSIDETINRVTAPDGGNYIAIRVSATKNKALKNDYFACEILNDLGLKNAVTDSKAADDLSVELIALTDPDRIFVVLQGDEEKAVKSFESAFTSHPVWKELSAVKNGKLFILPKDLFQYKPNALWNLAYDYAYGLIYEK